MRNPTTADIESEVRSFFSYQTGRWREAQISLLIKPTAFQASDGVDT
ncbi:hypothetical protein D1AOALGA4SA_870 [Olavius algarvensis Delta 1 endosymbiont]|nr:hypothetical protein D1AOALGA4SA_870 [Olavius algarvensis Delta 1 endosymbiont]